ncbi:hypothetical protein Ciccas_014552 [Cichlidogyrus casuarinus]|uniref:Transposase IS30-like HTH domain-containing protein n=1 Tax=Cichlidogyrus casuarinus TaxID=1844966 RepID=A0ABD2PIL6_9PLAT
MKNQDRTPLNSKEIDIILRMRELGETFRSIQKVTGRSLRVIKKCCDHKERMIQREDKEKPSMEIIKHLALNMRLTSSEIKHYLGLKHSDRTIRNWIHKYTGLTFRFDKKIYCLP